MTESLDRRALGGAALAAGLVTTLRLPPASAADSTGSSSSSSSFTVGFDLAATAPLSSNSWGLALTPSIEGPGGSGTPPESGPVRLLSLSILFVGGSGDKESVLTPGRDLAVYSTMARRSGAAVASEAIGGVVSRWSDASVAGASGSNTWLTFEFLGGLVQLDVATESYVAPISGDAAFTNATFLGTTSTASGGTNVINGSSTKNPDRWVLARASFTA